MGLLTIILDNTDAAALKSQFDLQIPNGIPINGLSLVSYSLVRKAGTTARMVKIRIPFLSSTSGLVTATTSIDGSPDRSPDGSRALVIPIDPAATALYQHREVVRHFQINEQVLPPLFRVETLAENNSPSNDIIDHMILEFSFHQSRLL